jgi:F-type H+-transporting ATPase subunit epsilon
MSLNVNILTLGGAVLEYKLVDEMILLTTTGEIGILTEHTPLLTALDIGVARIRKDAKWLPIVIMGGGAQIEDNTITIVSNSIEEANSIDLETVRKEFQDCESFLKDEKTLTKKQRIDAAVKAKKAKARIHAVKLLCSIII